VYAFGKGDEGQLGVGKRRQDVFLPENDPNSQRVLGLDHETIVAVAAGARTSYAITVSGLVYEW
jgi:alpha-tubulin suppressor-like RCC1 family protein